MNKKKLAIGILALIGFITTIKLAVIYYNANFNEFALSSFCSVNSFIDCDGVAKTSESQFFGIPLAYWGLFLYSFIFLLLFADKLKNIVIFKFLEVFKNPMAYIASLGVISFAISMCLLFISLFEIKKLCILCAFTYLLDFLIAVIASSGTSIVNCFKQSFVDFIDALKIRKYAIAFSAAALLAAGFLCYTTVSYKFVPQLKNQKEFKEFSRANKNKYAVSGNILGDKDAKLVVHTYTDYMCPMCYSYNIMIHKMAKELKGVRFEHHNYPLDTECNKYLRSEFHHGSCLMAKYAIAAEKQGKFWDMNTKLFEKQPKNVQEILEIAKDLNLDLTKLQDDANSLETMKKIQNEISEAASIGINGTPSTVINGKVHIGMQKYSDMKQWIIDEK